jgi:hypothetical protein
VPCCGGVTTIKVEQSICPHDVVAWIGTSTLEPAQTVAFALVAVTAHTVTFTVAWPTHAGDWSFATRYANESEPTNPALGVYLTLQPAHAPVPVQPTTIAVPFAGGVVIVKLAQFKLPHVVESLASTGMFTDEPEHTVATSFEALTAHTFNVTVAMPVHGGVRLLDTL